MPSKACLFTVDKATGLLGPASYRRSPNREPRPGGVDPSLIVVHGISLPPGEFGGAEIEALFTNTEGADLEMRLYNPIGEVIDNSMGFENNESIERTTANGELLAAGTYFVEMYGYNDADQNEYTLNLTISP